MSMKATLVNHVATLGPHLHETMAHAMANAIREAKNLDHGRFPYLRPHLTRAYWRTELDKRVLPLDWAVEGNTRQQGQTYLSNQGLNAKMRIVKERRRTYPGGVPPAGSSPARRKEWAATQPIEGLVIPGYENMPLEPLNLLLCWDYASGNRGTDFLLRVVHTLEPGSYGESVKCDLVIDIEPGGGIQEYRRFGGSDDHEDFFETIDIRKEENGH